MKALQKYFTIKINGVEYVPTIEERNYTYRLYYDTPYNLILSYPIIKDDYSNDGWKVIKDSIKEDMRRKLKQCEIDLRRKELFGVWAY